uniref:Large ribosomal subunit protein mL46 n=1 Tax=Panagrolaimus superbus TaxID=310955 RepID=A0A914Z5U2_9BILA
MFKLSCRFKQVASSALANDASKKFDIFASVAICRSPIIAPEMNEIQKKFVHFHNEIEDENSFKSDFELRVEKDIKTLEKKRQLEAEGKDLSQLEGEIGTNAMMQEDDWIKKKETVFEQYGIGKHASEHNDNFQTLSRYLDRKLMLVVKQKFENSSDDYSSPWILPQLKNSNESLRQTAERCIGDVFVNDMKLRIYGNSPIWHISYSYPKKMRELLKTDAVGGKIFVFQCVLEPFSRDPKINSKWIKEFKWSTAKEIGELIESNNPYQKTIKHVMFE